MADPELRLLRGGRLPGDMPERFDELQPLAERARQGDPIAVRSFIVAVGPHLLRVVRRVLGSTSPDLEDATQESALGLLDALNRFRGECTVVHLAYRVAFRTSLKWKRHQLAAKRGTKASSGLDPESLATTAASPETTAQERLMAQLVRQVLATLPEAQAEALGMHFVLGCTVSEVAEATGLSVETIRSRLRLGKAALRNHLRDNPRLLRLLEEVG